MRKKRKQNKISINETKLVAVVPGMLISAKTLIELGNSYEITSDLFAGNTVSSTMIVAQCAELLLKYKIQQEGKNIEKTHNLYNLFNTLKDESKTEIQRIFEGDTSTNDLPKGWDSVESIFQKAQNAFIHWRYVVSSTEGKESILPGPLYTAALSVYKSLPIFGFKITPKKVLDPAIKSEIRRITHE